MQGKQTFVAGAGAALVLVNFWTSPQRSTIIGGIYGNGDPATAHQGLIKLGGEILFVVVATILAGLSDNFATIMVLVIVALFILWAMHHYGPKQTAPSHP